MNLFEIAKACNGRLVGNGEIEIIQYSNDTRTLQKGALYIPIVGEVFDGHRFISQAFEKGAVATLSSHQDETYEGACIYVEDTLKAFQDIAHYTALKANVPIVGITGSVGKTSTRDMVGAVVSSYYSTLKTEGNFNNHIGVPITIMRYDNEEAMVLEMGMNHLREIAKLVEIARPNIGVITNVGTAHIGLLGSRENILKAKLEMAEYFDENNTLIINLDNDMLEGYYKNADVKYKIKTFAIKHDADVKAENVCLYESRSTFDYKGMSYEVNVPGEHFVLNALAAIAVGECLNIPYEYIKEAIQNFELTKNRMDFVHLKNEISIIDGTYNANLDSMLSSLAVLGKYERRKIAVLADMLELGEFSKELHLKTGKAVDENKIDVLICVGNESKYVIDGAENTKDKHWFSSNQEAYEYLKSILQPKDIVLVKGSNSMRLKEIITQLKEND